MTTKSDAAFAAKVRATEAISNKLAAMILHLQQLTAPATDTLAKIRADANRPPTQREGDKK